MTPLRLELEGEGLVCDLVGCFRQYSTNRDIVSRFKTIECVLIRQDANNSPSDLNVELVDSVCHAVINDIDSSSVALRNQWVSLNTWESVDSVRWPWETTPDDILN